MTAMDDRPLNADALISELEGHLLVEAARAEGRAEAVRFTRSLAWLTDTQREEVEAGYQEHYLALTRRSWERTAQRGRELRAEYEERYRSLRRRLCAACLFGAALVLTTVVVTNLPT
ncbi:hypothetical protein GCM10011579_031660 [Streptomyces albiflavescens]|uniref:Uncharacterized protein n=1 Tax=Streptomyces albiflavescens TaxID=1623582 RepID=A0A918D4C2_9ACTN|nr:hypothetical protein [Streptomyces albiflavescens]GGN63381.1 hypothetical protein GCM10011579_031660 [Streptomyces albiflavescens]